MTNNCKVIDYFTSNRLQVQLLSQKSKCNRLQVQLHLKVIVITSTTITITFGPISDIHHKKY